MNRYSYNSQNALDSCHIDLQLIFTDALQVMDHSILEGHRSEKRQRTLFLAGKTKLTKGQHNTEPSEAVDAIPYPEDWADRERMTLFAGIVKGIAYKRGVKIRWGGDWNSDTEVKDNEFDDLSHFELEKPDENH